MRIVSRLFVPGLALSLLSGCAPRATETAATPPPLAAAPAPAPAAKAPAKEAAPGAAKPVKAQPLTEKSIKECLAAAKDPKLAALTEKYKGQPGAMGTMAAGLAAADASAEVQAIVKSHGFASWEEWAGTTTKLWMGAFKVNMAKAEKDLKGAPPEAAKMAAAATAQMRQSIEESEKNVGKLTDAELKVVEKLLPEIEQLTK